MPPSSLTHTLRRLWALDKFAYSLRVFIALAGALLLCWWQDRIELLIPLFLGIIASALAETDDNWLGRLQALLVTLLCFSVAAFAVELLFPYPWLFVSGMALSAFGMILLGALGERYAAIASATLILSIYTMIGVDQRGGEVADVWHEPLLLVAGAAWYGLLSVLWNALFSNQPVQQSLSRLYFELGEYLRIKSSLFEPLRQLDVEGQRLALARQNGKVVVALNQAKETILNRLGHGRPGPKVSRYLKLYFIAQDVHERASSSHYPYNRLAEAFFHSDVLFRCQRLLNQQGKACQALALTAGYGVLHWIHPTQGYWILLTTVFVCQPNYGATRLRLVQRILGTVVGLVGGWALIDLFPSPLVQSLFAVAAGVAFFATRSSRYTLATAAITLLVLFCFNQVGDGYGLILPRLFDTLLGSLIAGLAVFLVLPDWQGRRLNRMLANTLACNSRYLRQIMQQYATGKRDDLDYRTARRNAHNADAALSTTLSNMLLEPGHFRKDAEIGFRFLVLSHTLLSYLSGLGAHRESLPEDASDGLLERAAERLSASLEEIAASLEQKRPVAIYSEEEEALAKELEQMPEDMDDSHRLVQTQLAHICRQLAPLRTLAAHLLKKELAGAQPLPGQP